MQGSEQQKYVNVEFEAGQRRSKRIGNLNDALRCGGISGRVMMTSGIQSLGNQAILELGKQIAAYDTFS